MPGRFLAWVLLWVPVPAGAACVAESAPYTAALVELYTSHGCSGCPAAERWLSRLGSRFAADRVLPLALHADYWEYLGRKDPYAQRRLSERQGRLSLLQRMALVDTPHVMLQGREFRPWGSGEFDDAVKRINAQPERARLKVEIRSSGPGLLAASVQGRVADPAQRRDAVLYMAAFRVSKEVTVGDNAAPSPAIGYAVLEWQGPFSPRSDGLLVAERSLALLPGATRDASGVAAFVQNRRTAEVLQAVLLPACSP